EVRPEYERNSPRMSSNSYVNLKIATCLVRYADDRLIDQRFPRAKNRTRRTVTIFASHYTSEDARPLVRVAFGIYL
ncbi:hypothetical protein, partial [Burkholderia multivorans]|uniref:hypothetical protein n=1 Tax=Burkholderia multivorans TaxID=87883 RepID=UPI001C26A049